MWVRFEKVRISFGATDVLEDANFQINAGDRIGLIGRNGSGKTTLLRLIAGDLEPEAGRIVRSAPLQLSYLEQWVHSNSTATVWESAQSVLSHFVSQEHEMEELSHRVSDSALAASHSEDLARLSDLMHQFELRGGYAYRARVEQVLMGLGFSREDFSKSYAEISGGQMNRLHLARLLLSEPNLLLLDEPTNHLDLEAVNWLEDFLKSYPHAFLLVSHDRYFLNRAVDRVFELEHRSVRTYRGNYSAYQKQKALRVKLETQAYEQQREWIKATENFIRRNRAGQKTKQAQSRRKMLSKVERLEKPTPPEEAARFDFHVTLPSAHRVLMIERGAIGYQDPIVRDMDFKLFRGERYGIVGKNGTGKSTFLKTLRGQLRKLSGTWVLGERVHVGYYDQKLEDLNPAHHVLEELHSLAPAMTAQAMRSYAARFLFRGEEVFQKVENLSGGEKSRLSLAKLMWLKPNVLLLDEPTNHLDIASREALESALAEYDGTLLVVSHDRYLLERLVSRLLVFEAGRMLIFEGSYSAYRSSQGSDLSSAQKIEARGSESQASVDKRGARGSLEDVPSEKKRKARSIKQPSTNRERQRVQDMTRLEDEIMKVEAELRDVETRLADPSSYADPNQATRLSETYQSIQEHLNQLYEEWAALEVKSG